MKTYIKFTCHICNKDFERELRQCSVKTEHSFCSKECLSCFYKQKINCNICGKEFTRQGLSSHIWRMHGDGVHHNPNLNIKFPNNREIWNKGLTKESSPIVAKISASLSNTLNKQVIEGTYTPRIMSIEAREKLSIEQSTHNRGGKSKWFDIGGQKVQGTWEKNLAEKFQKLSITWYKLKCRKDIFYYYLDDKKKSYTPDFYLPEYDVYLEVKGYWWGNDKEKMNIVFNTYPSLKDKTIIVQKDKYQKLIDISNKEEFLMVLWQ